MASPAAGHTRPNGLTASIGTLISERRQMYTHRVPNLIRRSGYGGMEHAVVTDTSYAEIDSIIRFWITFSVAVAAAGLICWFLFRGHARKKLKEILGEAAEEVQSRLILRCAAALPPILERIQDRPTARDIRAYLPGQPTFICARNECSNACCKKRKEPPYDLPIQIYSGFEGAVRSELGMTDDQFIVRVGGRHFLKKDECGRCVLLDDAHQCRMYDIQRPADCITYPFEMVFFDLQPDGSVRKIDYRNNQEKNGLYDKLWELPRFFRIGEGDFNCIIPLIVYHDTCPGLTGDPISMKAYLCLVDQLWEPYRALAGRF